MKNSILTLLICALSQFAMAAYSQTFKERSFPASLITSLHASGIQGNYTFSKSDNDSVQIKVVVECKDMKAFSEFSTKYSVQIEEQGGKLTIHTPKYATSLGMLFYEIRIPEKLMVSLTLEEGNVSIKEMVVQMKVSQQEGNLFTDNISGNFDLTARKVNATLRTKEITCTLLTGNSTVQFLAKKGKVTLGSGGGDIQLQLTNDVEVQADKKSDELKIIVPSEYHGQLEVSSDKKPVRLDFNDVLLNGTISPQLIKCIAGKGGSMLRVSTVSAQVTIGNSVSLTK